MPTPAQINVRSGLHAADIFVTGAQAQASTSSFVTVANTDLDASAWNTLSYTVVAATNNIAYQVLGANVSDYSDAVVVKASTTVNAGATDSYTVSPAPFRYYRIQIKDNVGGTHGTGTINGMLKP